MFNRSIAILIDAGFFLKRIKHFVENEDHTTDPKEITKLIKKLCAEHIKNLTRCEDSEWLSNTYRIFYYDATPYDKQAHDPIHNRQINFANTAEAIFRNALFSELRKTRKVALRLGKVIKDSDWTPPANKTRKILPTRELFNELELVESGNSGIINLSEHQIEKWKVMKRRWEDIKDEEITLGLRQKGVDMRIGIDIVSLTLKKQVDTIILVSGDSDFVPAAKLARREGIEFILDPLWQSINEDLFEHIDGLHCGLKKHNHN